MQLSSLLDSLADCPCGDKHAFDTRVVEIAADIDERAEEILAGADFPRDVLIVADKNTLAASRGFADNFPGSRRLIYDDMRYARVEQVREVNSAAQKVGGIIAIGSGSLGDICRVVAAELGKPYCIFATAPSMDGFASDSAPIIENDFKTSWRAKQPEVILASTRVLSAAPEELKAAGFGDMIAKHLGIFDWKLSKLLIGEHYCGRIARMTLDAVEKCVHGGVKETMEGLVLSGLAMKLAHSSRPASGSEHVLSHYWECAKLARGEYPGLHGTKVGVATLVMLEVYRNVALRVEKVNPTADKTDWKKVRGAFTERQLPEVLKINLPTITDEVSPEKLRELWPVIRKMILETLPPPEKVRDLMKKFSCATTPEEIHVEPELFERGLRYHNYMRRRIHFPRLFPMLGLDIMDFVK